MPVEKHRPINSLIVLNSHLKFHCRVFGLTGTDIPFGVAF